MMIFGTRFAGWVLSALLLAGVSPKSHHTSQVISSEILKYPNGRIRRISELRDGVPDGTARGWFPSGSPMLEYHYRAGLSEGVQRQWYPNGKLLYLFHHRAGHEEGQQQMWNPDGTIRSNYVIRDGKRYGLLGSMGCTGKNRGAPTE